MVTQNQNAQKANKPTSGKIKVVFDSSKTSVKKGAHAIGCQN